MGTFTRISAGCILGVYSIPISEKHFTMAQITLNQAEKEMLLPWARLLFSSSPSKNNREQVLQEYVQLGKPGIYTWRLKGMEPEREFKEKIMERLGPRHRRVGNQAEVMGQKTVSTSVNKREENDKRTSSYTCKRKF